jgi:hypothetical protein
MYRSFLTAGLVLISCSNSLFAQTSNKKDDQSIGVTLYSEDYPAEYLHKEVFEVSPPTQGTAVLGPTRRQEVLNKAQLAAATSTWDHLEKDILILRASKNSIEELKKKYPRLPKQNLLKLQQLLQGQ